MSKVFSEKKFNIGDTVERCNLINVRRVTGDLEDKLFYVKRRLRVMAEGNAPLYNHSENPNLDYSYVESKITVEDGQIKNNKRKIIFSAIKTIEEGEELTIDHYLSEDISRKRANHD